MPFDAAATAAELSSAFQRVKLSHITNTLQCSASIRCICHDRLEDVLAECNVLRTQLATMQEEAHGLLKRLTETAKEHFNFEQTIIQRWNAEEECGREDSPEDGSATSSRPSGTEVADIQRACIGSTSIVAASEAQCECVGHKAVKKGLSFRLAPPQVVASAKEEFDEVVPLPHSVGFDADSSGSQTENQGAEMRSERPNAARIEGQLARDTCATSYSTAREADMKFEAEMAAIGECGIQVETIKEDRQPHLPPSVDLSTPVRTGAAVGRRGRRSARRVLSDSESSGGCSVPRYAPGSSCRPIVVSDDDDSGDDTAVVRRGLAEKRESMEDERCEGSDNSESDLSDFIVADEESEDGESDREDEESDLEFEFGTSKKHEARNWDADRASTKSR